MTKRPTATRLFSATLACLVEADAFCSLRLTGGAVRAEIVAERSGGCQTNWTGVGTAENVSE